MNLKILLLDIETAPNIAYVWGLFKENIPIQRIINSGYVLSWAAKWLGEKAVFFNSEHKTSQKRMLKHIHRLLDEADIVIHYNGKSFDIPTLNKEFVKAGLHPPSPYKQIDLYQVVKAVFRFPSNKLDYVLQALKLGKKVRHPGFEMWVKCMAGDPTAWKQMERYNRGDVTELEKLYRRLLPWIKPHPNVAVTGDACPHCGKRKLVKRGYYRMAAGTEYQRFECGNCHAWSRGATPFKRIKGRIVSLPG
jgi:DNA polymerase elongation subunit (family B)